MAYGKDSGYATKFSGPDFDLLAKAYGIPGCLVSNEEKLTLHLHEYIDILQSENPMPCILAIRYDSDELLPYKPQAVGIIEDFKNASKTEGNPYLMKLLMRNLKERLLY